MTLSSDQSRATTQLPVYEVSVSTRLEMAGRTDKLPISPNCGDPAVGGLFTQVETCASRGSAA